jgi:Protein of unknown function (DUF1631)
VLNQTSKSEGKSDVRAGAPAAGLTSDNRKRYELLDECREAIMTRLSRVMHEAMDKMSEQLSNDAMVAVKREEQQALLEAASMVNQHRSEIENRFRRSFGDIFERRLFASKDAVATVSLTLDQLSLVSEEDINNKMAVDRLVHKAKGKLDPSEVLGIRARFGALLDREWFEEDSHPAAPEAIFEALKACLGQFDARPEVAGALLNAIEPHISSNLNAIYAKINERLVSRRVLPIIRPTFQSNPSAQRARRAGLDDRIENAIETAPGQQLVDSGYGAVMPSGSGQDARTMAAAQWLASLDDPNAALSAMLASMAQGNPHARANATRLIADPHSFGLIDLPDASPAEMIGKLSAMQDFAVDMAVAPSAVSRNVSEHVRESSSPLDQLMVDVVSMVFDYIYRDDRINDSVKQQLLRMQVVAIKAALIDKSFFARRQHPMRQFLEGVVDLVVDPESDTSDDSLITNAVREMVDEVTRNFDEDLSLFDTMLVKLEELNVKEQARREDWLLKETEQTAAKDVEAAQQEVERSKLLERLDSNSPIFVRAFLLRWWPAVMVKLINSGNEQAPVHGLRIAEGLIWSVAPKNADEIPRLASLLPKLINGLMKGLRMIDIEADERESFFNELLRTHTRAIEAAKTGVPNTEKTNEAGFKQEAPSVVIDANGSLQFRPRTKTLVEEPLYAATVTLGQATIDTFARGTMFSITREDSQVQRLKLSWISPSRKFFLLTRFPDVALQLDRSELMSMLDDGRAFVIHTPQLVDNVVEAASQEAAATV